MNIKISEKVVSYRIKNKENEELKEPIGAYIKRERIAQGLNQDFVCKGICSVSYYSRIENNIIVPTNNYIERIFLKLNKPVPKELSTLPINNEVIDNFLTAIIYHNDRLVDETYQKLIMYDTKKLYAFVYFLYQHKICEAEKLLSLLHNQQIYFSNDELLVYLESIGSLYIQKKEYEKAEKYLSHGLTLQESIGVRKPLLLYKYAWVLGKLNDDIKSIEYAQEAEVIFKKSNNIYRSIQTQILIAIKLSNRFPEKSIELYENLLKVTNNSNLICFNNLCMFNLANTLKKYKMYKKSEIHFIELIQTFNLDSQFVLDVYVEFIDLLLLINKKEEALKYYKILKELNDHSERYGFYIKYYELKFNVSSNLYKIESYNLFLIPYCIKNKNLDNELRCRKELAEILEKNNNVFECIKEYKKIISIMDKNKDFIIN